MAHLTNLMGTLDERGRVQMPPEKAVVLMALLGLDDLTDELLDLSVKTDPKVFSFL